jgi:hypothetical protein
MGVSNGWGESSFVYFLNQDYAEEDEEDDLKVSYFIFFIFFSVIQVHNEQNLLFLK